MVVNNKDQNDSNNEDDIDLRPLINILIRNWSTIVIFTSVSFVFSVFYALSQTRLYQGEFQIVLSQTANNLDLGDISSAAGIKLPKFITKGGNQGLKTQVGILESPSVLMPVLDFLIDKKNKKQKSTSYQTIKFSSWIKSNLKISLKEQTSILEIKYRDEDKEVILPVLNRISEAYQMYSVNDRKKQISDTLIYLDEQILVYKKKALDSLSAVNEFARENDLSIGNKSGEIRPSALSVLPTEIKRIEAVNEYRMTSSLIDKFELLNGEDEAQYYFGIQLPAKETLSFIHDKIALLDENISLLESIVKPEDFELRRLKMQKAVLIEKANKQMHMALIAKREQAKAAQMSAERPKEVLIKYRELFFNAFNDQRTLTKLITDKRVVSLEKARSDDPWKLITKPTVLNHAVAPSRRATIFFGMLLGGLSGVVASFFLEYKKDLTFSVSEIQKILGWPFLDEFGCLDPKELQIASDLLVAGTLADEKNGRIALIPVGDIDTIALGKLRTSLEKSLKSQEIIVTRDLRESIICSKQLIILANGKVTRKELRQVKSRLDMQKTPVAGWLMLNES